MIKCPICNSNTCFLTRKKDRFGQEYEYLKCENCRFLFEKDLVENNTNLSERVSRLYQKDYFEKIDAGWKARGDGFLKIIKKIIAFIGLWGKKKSLSVLDYGGGNGYIASQLSEDANVLYYDKYDTPNIGGKYSILASPRRADIIYAVELVEHLTDLKEWDFLNELFPKVFIFTTCLVDNIKDDELLDWEYFNPDAGHTALYSTKSLYLLAKKYGFTYMFFPNISTHIFLRNTFLSKFNFVKVEYFLYDSLRKLKHLFV